MSQQLHTVLKRQVVEAIEKGLEREGISQAELGRRMGCSAAHVSRLLRAHRTVRLTTLVRMARALKQRLQIDLVSGRRGRQARRRPRRRR